MRLSTELRAGARVVVETTGRSPCFAALALKQQASREALRKRERGRERESSSNCTLANRPRPMTLDLWGWASGAWGPHVGRERES